MYFVNTSFKDAGHPFYIKIDEVEINYEFAYHIDAYIIR